MRGQAHVDSKDARVEMCAKRRGQGRGRGGRGKGQWEGDVVGLWTGGNCAGIEGREDEARDGVRWGGGREVGVGTPPDRSGTEGAQNMCMPGVAVDTRGTQFSGSRAKSQGPAVGVS